MKFFLLICTVVLMGVRGYSQLNNNWIDYNKTYYKFKIAKDTLCRITQPVLEAAGLGNTPAEDFQLWRNGKEVPLYTSVATGILGTADFIEFWGQMNDGKPDKNLYLNTDYQLSDKYSLETDTATYFLTINSGAANLRYIESPNNTTGSLPNVENYFMRRIELHFRAQINRGYAKIIGERVFSSSYDIGEGRTSNSINPCCALVVPINNLNAYTSNTNPEDKLTFTIAAAGNANNSRSLLVKINGTSITPQVHPMDFFSYRKDTIRNLPLSILTNPNSLQVGINGTSAVLSDQIVVSNISVTYPATFNFNNEKNFYFELKRNTAGNYLVINNFNYNGVAPVLYDMTNYRRYVGDITTPGQVKFALPASSIDIRKFNLVNQDVSNILRITALQSKTFVNYALPANQGDYIIISNPKLYDNGSGINNVEGYREYRSSITGGSFNAKIYDINELNDQFGFGIKKHPSAIRDFIRYASQYFTPAPKYVFIIGRGLTYYDYDIYKANPLAESLDMVQTFGWPASDILLACQPGTNPPSLLVPIGRLGAINGTEVGYYLEKMKQYEQNQQSSSQTIADRGWMKNVLHAIGGSNDQETGDFKSIMSTCEKIIKDTLYGGNVENFVKSSVLAVEQEQSLQISQLFQKGLSYVKYFGHSSADNVSINLNYPESYNNAGKYPFFHVSGCIVGNFYAFNPLRVNGYSGMTLSEKYIFQNQKGSIGFLGNTHFGIPTFLKRYNIRLYNFFSKDMYGNTIGNQLKSVIQSIGSQNDYDDFYDRIHIEEIGLHGDPALKINSFEKPDYVIEDPLIKLTPTIISTADAHFSVNIKMMNIGKAVNDSIRVIVKQRLTDNVTERTLYNMLIPGIRYMDSLVLNVPVNPVTDKGLNKLIVSLDDDNLVDELFETNNSVTKDFYIFEDELKPVWPTNYSIVNQQNITYAASTAYPLTAQRQYILEIDTTERFNSPIKKTHTRSGKGGIVEFKPSDVIFTDSTVYYWRTAMVPATGDYIWNTFSFIYLPSGGRGYNQSHYYQHTKSTYSGINYDSDRKFDFISANNNLRITTGLYPTYTGTQLKTTLNESMIEFYGCRYSSLQFIVLDGVTLEPWKNATSGGRGRFGSFAICQPDQFGNRKIFEFPYGIQGAGSAAAAREYRKKAMDFLVDSIPDSKYIIVTNLGRADNNTSFINEWKSDETIFGPGNSIYHKLKNFGFTKLDSFYKNIPFLFVFKKGDNTFTPLQVVGDNSLSYIDESITVPSKNISGTITSPLVGPAKSWEQFHWRGTRLEQAAGDSLYFNIIGISPQGTETILYTVDSTTKDFDISGVNATTYPFLKMKMFNQDKIWGTPYQLKYWRLNYTPVPEGVLAPNILFVMNDTVDQGEKIDFKIAFKNVSSIDFDSLMKIHFTVIDKNNISHQPNIPKGKKLIAGDTLVVSYQIDTRNYTGNNVLFVDINPENDQREQYHFNNVLYKDFYVKGDVYRPLLDVTFDGIHILNKDIVSAKPNILVHLKDESRFLELSDTALIKLQVRFPDGSLHDYHFGDSMRFTPANLSTGQNTAMIEFTPWFPEEGEYELIVSGRDVAGNSAGNIDYRVVFTVISKTMISNLLNYPNPFTTSTAFVFTITGSEIPQNIRIQILTITGKIVREITKEELGPIRVGRNITEFKWDGTDTYGQKLANGVYLYRVLTNLNGKSVEKYKSADDQTDKYFNKGYGKMVILR